MNQRQVALYEFEPSLVYYSGLVSFRSAKATIVRPCLKTKPRQNKTKQKEMPKNQTIRNKKAYIVKLGVALLACDRDTPEAEAGESPQVGDQSRLHSECQAS